MADEGPSCEELAKMTYGAAYKIRGCYDMYGWPQGNPLRGVPQDTCEIRWKYCNEDDERKKHLASRP